MVFPGRRKIIFVHGCFWHQHDDPACKLTRIPKSRLDYWGPKLEKTKQRDKAHLQELAQSGWEVLTLWECEIRNTTADDLSRRIELFLQE